jgi:hypothetical protein
MCMRLRDLADGILDSSAERLPAAQAKWSRFGPGDFSAIANKQDLINSVEKHYNLSHAAAVKDVELWDARVRRMHETPERAVEQNEVSP